MKTIEEIKKALLKEYERHSSAEKENRIRGHQTGAMYSFGRQSGLKSFGMWELNMKEKEFKQIRTKYFPDEN